MHGGMKQPPCSLLSHQTVKNATRPKKNTNSRKTRWSDWAYILCFYWHGSARLEALGGVLTRSPALSRFPSASSPRGDSYLSLVRCGLSRVWRRPRSQPSLLAWKAAKEDGRQQAAVQKCDWWESNFEGKKTPHRGALAGCTVYLSQRHLGLICRSHCQQAPVFLALTCERPWKFWQTAKQAVSGGRRLRFSDVRRAPRTVPGVALRRICIPQAPTFTVHVRSLYDSPIYIFIQPSFLWCFGGLIQLSAGVFLVQPCTATRASSNVICKRGYICAAVQSEDR